MQTLKARWKNGDCVINGWLSLPCAFSAEMMARQAWDCLTIDRQHGLADEAMMLSMLTAAANKPVLVRVPWLAEGDIMKTLDAGAAGIICPMINNRAEAERFAACVRYPPAGRRSFGPVRARLLYGEEYFARANDEVVALAMIETCEGVANADEICSVAGIDGVYIGPADLSVSYGCAPTFAPTDAAVTGAIDAIITAARRHRRIVGIHTNDVGTARAARTRGFDLITAATDARLLAAAGAAVLTQLQNNNDNKNKKGAGDEKQTDDHGAGVGKVSDGATY